MFVPQFKSLFDNEDMELSIVESMGLKVQYNTRRLIADDSKELLHRLVIQYKVNQARLQELDEELSYLEDELNSITKIPSQQTNQNFFRTKTCSFFEESSASWPGWHSRTIKQFASENKLNHARHMDRSNIFDKLKRFLGSIAFLRYSHNNLDDKLKQEEKGIAKNNVQRSNPEISGRLSVPFNPDLNKMNSEGFVRKSY
ncbi:hypothetical protein GWI33_001180 [Rhynchophorus ferrugineus]|uniref:Uncharacterized protein n=1 Tax=Rhynchophorus ferrugineus TaxID=354439 RepID=A0A834HM45_RHYFE|nr:hypothetical protein GWI33_001180 [Rhynchophorus ferrugineus]